MAGSEKTGSRCVVLQGAPIVDEQRQASAAIIPGHLVEINAGKWRKHASAAGAAGAFFALERDELGSGIDTAYAADDYVKVGTFAPGDVVNALIPSGEAVTEGAELQSDGAGRLTAGTTKPVARAGATGTPSSADANGYRLRCIVI